MFKHRTFIFLIASLLTAFIVSSAVAQDRGIIPVQIKSQSGQEVFLYNESHALVIGVSDYTGGWPDLPGVSNDLNLVKKTLVKQGFNVVIAKDPNRGELIFAFEDFINNYGQDPNNRLLFYFAGHGHTLRMTYGQEMGYIIPREAPNPNLNEKGFRAVALSMQRMEEYAKSIQSKHALFLFDSCFSGSLFSLTRAIPENINYKTSRPVRQFITAGMADERVPDTSIFSRQFIDAFQGEGDLDKDGYLTGLELGEFLQKTVVNYSKGNQHPQYGTIRDPDLDKGDFVFVLFDSATLNKNIEPLRSKQNLQQEWHVLENKRLLEQEKKRLEEKRRMKVTSLPPKPSLLSSKIPEEMILIPSSEYTAGMDFDIGYRECTKYYSRCKRSLFSNESPKHTLLIDSFLIDKHEVTQADFERAMGNNPSKIKGEKHPVERVTWTEARDYCGKVGKRLPTEAEWEKAAKGGRDTIYFWGNKPKSWKANFCDLNCDFYWKQKEFNDGHAATAPVGSFDPNGYELYDMAGNVYEWVSDWYSEDYYKTSPRNNPQGPPGGETKVLRGGAWNNNPSFVRPTYRYSKNLKSRLDNIGFRCASTLRS
jgi:formylglycine-generating enzyme required for sulfatase activity